MADKDKNNPNLGCLEEDDEFEEFPVEGMIILNFWFSFNPLCFNWSVHATRGFQLLAVTNPTFSE